MAASGVSAALRFLAFPLLASIMSVEEFGRASLFLATLPFLALAMSWNLAVPWVVDYHGLPDERNRRRMGGAMSVVLGSSFFLGVAAWILHPWIESRMDFGVGPSGYLQMIACSMLSSLSLLHLELDKIRQESGRYLASSLLQTVLQLGAALLWVLFRGPSFASFLAGHTAGCLLVVVVQVLARSGGQSPLWPGLSDTLLLWRRALPIALSSAFALVASLGDRQFVRAATGYADVAIYSMGAKIGEIVQQVLQTPLLAAMAPILLAIAHKEPERFADRFRIEMRRFLGLVLFATTALGAALDPLYALLLPPSYAPGIPISILFLWGFAIGGVGQAWATTILARGRLEIMMRLTSTAAASSLALNALLTPRFHSLGAAIAAVCVQAITCILSWAYAGDVRNALDKPSRTVLGAILVLPALQLAAASWIHSILCSLLLRSGICLVGLTILWHSGILGEAVSALTGRLRGTLLPAPKSR